MKKNTRICQVCGKVTPDYLYTQCEVAFLEKKPNRTDCEGKLITPQPKENK